MNIYTYNDTEFSEEEVIAAAKESGMDVNSYINKVGIKKSGPGKKKPAAVVNAPVAGKNTESKLAKPSLDSSNNGFGRVKLFDPLNITKNMLASTKDAAAKNEEKRKITASLSNNSLDFIETKKEPTTTPKTGLGSSSVMWRESNQKAIDKKLAEKTALEEKQKQLDRTFPAREKEAKDEISFNNPNTVLKYDLQGDSAVETVQKLNKKLNRLGIAVEQNTFDNKFRFSPLNASNRQIEGVAGSLTPTMSYSNEGVSIDPNDDKSVNEYVSKFGNVNYLDDVKKRVSKVSPNYLSKITPPLLSEEKKIQGVRSSLIEGFKKLENKNAVELTDAYGVAIASRDITANDFKSKEEYDLYKAWKKNPNALLEIPEYKVEAWDQQRRTEYVKRATRDIGRQLPEGARKDLEIISQEAINDNKRLAQNFNLAGEKLNERSRQYQKNYEAYTKNPTTEGNILLKEEYTNLINEQNYLQDWQKKLAEQTKTTNEIMGPAIQNFGANYSRLSQLTTGLKKGAIDVIGAFDDIASYGSAAILGKEVDEIRKADTLGVSYMASELAKKQEQYQAAIGIDEIRSFDDAGNWLMSGVVNNAPSVAMAFTGQAAIPLFFASGYGGKRTQMETEAMAAKNRLSENYNAINAIEDPVERQNIEQQIAADEELLLMPEYKKFAAKTIYGAAEVGFELLGTLSIIKGLGDATKMLPKKTLKDGMLWAANTAVKNYNKEGLSELGTTWVDNFTDVHILGEDKNLLDSGLESYVQGGVFGVGFGIPQSVKVIKRAYVSELASKAQSRRIQEIADQISKLTGISGYKYNQDMPLPEQPAAVQKLINELIGESGDIEDRVLNRLGTDITVEQAKQIGDINRQIREVNKDFLEATQEGGIEPAQLKALEAHYRGKFNELVEQRETLLTDQNLIKEGEVANRNADFEFDLTEGFNSYNNVMRETSVAKVVNNFDNLGGNAKQPLLDAAKAKLEANGGEVSDKNIERQAKEDFVNNHYSEAIKKGVENAGNFARRHGLNMDLEVFESDPAKDGDGTAKDRIVKAYLEGDGVTAEQAKRFAIEIENGSAEGENITVNGKPKALIYLDNAVKNRRTGVGSHEVLHTAVKKAFKDQKGITQAGKDLLSYLEKFDPDLHALVTARINSSYGKKKDITGFINSRNDKGEIEIDEDSDYYEEAMNAMSDLAADGVELPLDALNAVRNFVNRILPPFMPKFKENEGANVYQFIKDYNREAHFGKKRSANTINFKGKSIGGDAENNKAKKSVTRVREVEQKIEKLENQFENDEIEYDDYTSRLEAFEKELEKAKATPEVESKPKIEKQKAETTEEDEVKEIIKEGKASIASDKVQKIYDEKGVNGAPEIISLFKPITKKIINKRRDAPGFEEDLFRDELESSEQGILGLIMKYDPSKGIPLAAYINKYLPVRAIAVSRKILDKEFSKDVTEEKGLMAEETVSETKEKPKYKNALESKVLAADGLKTVSNKIITILRTLKSRIDAPVSLNRTITPLISEIRDEVGKQLDIDIKTMLGGKKDGVLRKELLRNKRYILENMTTTWLMGLDGKGGIPQAIQKRIDGKWVNYPDWVGKKIDRESVSTDNAGRTSGAELVRRIPNVFNNVSDADFLGQIIGPDGNPIRGRKESVSKAMSEEIAFDIINDDLLNDGPISEALATNQTRLGVEILENLPQEFTKQAERGNVKASRTLTNLPLKSKEYFFNPKNYNKVINELTNINAGNFPPETSYIQNVLKNVYGDKIISAGDLDSIGKDFSDYFETIKALPSKKLNSAEEKQFLGDYIKKSVEFGGNELEGFVENQQVGAEVRSVTELFKNETSLRNMYQALNGFVSNIKNDSKSAEWYRMLGNFLATQAQIGDDTFITQDGLLENTGKDDFTMSARPGGPRSKISKKTGQETKKEFSYQPFSNKSSFWKFIQDSIGKDLPSGYNQNIKTNERDSASELFKNQNNDVYLENKKKTTLSNREFLYKLLDFIYNPANKVSDKTKTMIWASLNSSVESPLRKAGMAKWIFDGKLENPNEKLVYEHLTSVNNKKGELHDLFSSNASNKKEAFDKLMEDYNVAVIPKSMDDEITTFGFKVESLKGDETEGSRYYNIVTTGAKNLFPLRALDKNAKQKTLGKEFVEFVKEGDYNSAQKVAAGAYSSGSFKSSRTVSDRFNKIIEENKGVESYKNFSDIVARRRGIGKNKFDIYVPASAADFELLLYNFMGKSAKGEEQKKFFTDTLLKPYANGNDLMDAARQSIKSEYKRLLKEFPDVAKMIEKRTPDGDFTYDQAIRVAMWNEEGVDIPGLSQRDSNKLTDLVNSDPNLKAFKDKLIITGRQGRGWIKPEQYWDANTIITDLHNLTEGEGRKKFLSEFIANAEEMFGKFENGKLVGPNINKVEAVYGTDVREALEDVLYRMITGKNKSFGKDKETSAWANWVSGSTGAIMFLNVRSAALQLIGAVNFLNLRDNNPYAAAKAFANQKQYWEDFATIWNSDKMKERRGGLKEDVAAAEIANAAAGSKNKVGAVLSYLLKIGYTPTQMADSFAIASGGAPFYRNRIKTYLKDGMTEQEAEEAAWDDFTKVSDETQQSGDPRDISKQQASPAGRLLLTFQNTAMQQSRIVKKAVLDLKNGRGDAKTNFAKIAYYVAIQNTMFAVLQQGLFAVAFGDDDEDKDKAEKEKKLEEKALDVADGVLDTILRGTGFMGGIAATVKNMAKKYLDERDKKFKADYAKVVLEGANLSPPIGSKLRKLYSGLQQTKFDKDLIEARGWSVMQDGRLNLSPSYGVAGKLVEATTNVPMDRLVTKINNASEALNSQNTAMQRIMVGLGWSPYSAGIEDSAGDKKIREEAKAKRKIGGKIKAEETRERTKDSISKLPLLEQARIKEEKAAARRRRKMG
jgi:hypothetical protein